MRIWVFSVLISTTVGLQAHGLTCATVFGADATSYSALSFLDIQTQKVSERIQRENLSPDLLYSPLKLKLGAKRDDLTGFLYDNKIVEFSEATHLMADKLIMAKTLKTYLGARFTHFHPPTMGVKEFMLKHNLATPQGIITAKPTEIARALDKEFPKGFIVKPTLDWSSSGKSFYKDRQEIIDLLSKADNALLNTSDFLSAFTGNRTGRVGSGERLMLMGMIEGTGLSNAKYGENNEFRVHSFYGKVVKGATETRWYTPQDNAKIQAVDHFVQDLLSSLPKGFSHRMGLSFDVFVTPKGELQLIEVNTNRGERTNWSGFLRTPRTIGAYARHLKENYGWEIQGTEGWMFYHDLANAKKHMKHEIVEWMKDAADASKHDYALEGFRMLQSDYLDPVLKESQNIERLQSADFVDLFNFAREYATRLNKVKKVGDPAWQEFAHWTSTLELH